MKERKKTDMRNEFARRLRSVYPTVKNFEKLVDALPDTPPEFHRAVVDRVLTGGNFVFSDIRYLILARNEHAVACMTMEELASAAAAFSFFERNSRSEKVPWNSPDIRRPSPEEGWISRRALEIFDPGDKDDRKCLLRIIDHRLGPLFDDESGIGEADFQKLLEAAQDDETGVFAARMLRSATSVEIDNEQGESMRTEELARSLYNQLTNFSENENFDSNPAIPAGRNNEQSKNKRPEFALSLHDVLTIHSKGEHFTTNSVVKTLTGAVCRSPFMARGKGNRSREKFISSLRSILNVFEMNPSRAFVPFLSKILLLGSGEESEFAPLVFEAAKHLGCVSPETPSVETVHRFEATVQSLVEILENMPPSLGPDAWFECARSTAELVGIGSENHKNIVEGNSFGGGSATRDCLKRAAKSLSAIFSPFVRTLAAKSGAWKDAYAAALGAFCAVSFTSFRVFHGVEQSFNEDFFPVISSSGLSSGEILEASRSRLSQEMLEETEFALAKRAEKIFLMEEYDKIQPSDAVAYFEGFSNQKPESVGRTLGLLPALFGKSSRFMTSVSNRRCNGIRMMSMYADALDSGEASYERGLRVVSSRLWIEISKIFQKNDVKQGSEIMERIERTVAGRAAGDCEEPGNGDFPAL